MPELRVNFGVESTLELPKRAIVGTPAFLNLAVGLVSAAHLECSRSISFDYSIGSSEADDANNHSGVFPKQSSADWKPV
jgi:hypothetical protein